MLHELRKAHGFEKLGTFLRSLRSWKEYANLSQHGQNGGESARKTVKTESRDEPCPISVIGGASCPVSELRTKYSPAKEEVPNLDSAKSCETKRIHFSSLNDDVQFFTTSLP